MAIAASSSATQIHSKSNHDLGFASHTTAPGVTTTTMRHVPWMQHTLRQLKLVLPGTFITYYLGTLHNFWTILQGAGGSWAL